MSQHTEHPVFDGFLTLWAFNPKRQADITHSELLVYSALAHASRRHQILSNKDLSWRTGLDRNTVASALTSLRGKKLVEDRTALERLDLFWTTKKANAEHWSQKLRFWKCLVRCEGSKVRVRDQSVLSYVWWSKVTGFDPPKGWSERYVASIIKIKKETVERAISRLEQMCLMKRDGKQWLVPKFLSPMQEEWFVRKNVTPVEKVTLGEFEPDMRQLSSEYIPGEIMPPDSVSIPDTTLALNVEWLKVTEYLKPLLKIHQLSEGARHRIMQAARRDLDTVGTAGQEWKSVVDMHLQRYLANEQKTGSRASGEIVFENEELLRELEMEV